MMRLLVVACILLALLVARRAHLAWRRRLASDRRPLPSLPPSLVEGADRTWVVFTTPYCANCGPVTERIRNADPGAGVVTLDAGRHHELARAFHVRAAPTVVLADAEGRVLHRLVGAPAVDAYLGGDYVRRPA